MAWEYTLDTHYTVLEKRKYPWPCQPQPNRMLELWPGDVLTKHPNGSVTKHNGLCMTNIRVPESDLVLVEAPERMAVGSMMANVAVEPLAEGESDRTVG